MKNVTSSSHFLIAILCIPIKFPFAGLSPVHCIKFSFPLKTLSLCKKIVIKQPKQRGCSTQQFIMMNKLLLLCLHLLCYFIHFHEWWGIILNIFFLFLHDFLYCGVSETRSLIFFLKFLVFQIIFYHFLLLHLHHNLRVT